MFRSRVRAWWFSALLTVLSGPAVVAQPPEVAAPSVASTPADPAMVKPPTTFQPTVEQNTGVLVAGNGIVAGDADVAVFDASLEFDTGLDEVIEVELVDIVKLHTRCVGRFLFTEW